MNIYLRLVMCLVIILGRSSFAFGQNKVNWSGDISAQTISANTEVTLTGNVTLKGTVTINSGYTLTINGNNRTITTYTTTPDKTSTISFDVKGTLIMKYVTLEGGCVGSVGNYSDHDQSTSGKTNKGGETETNTTFKAKKNGNAINVYGSGKLQLTNVVAQNMYTNGDLGCFLQVGATGKEGDTVETIVNLNNVTVKNCLTDSDQGIINASGTHAINKIKMTNCTISYCMVKEEGTGHGYGGVLKGNGGTTCILDMTNCTMNNCWGSGWGGAILWAAGTPSENGEESKATLNKCQFYYNYARYLGGAISNEARMELTECTIEYNQAGFGGGGIAAFPFTLGSEGYEGLKEAVGLTLVEKNKISNNETLYVTNKGGANVTQEAIVKGKTPVTLTEDDYGFNPYYTHRMTTGNTCYPSGGGGLWVLMNMDGWSCNLSIGATNEITNNSSAYNGGGVFLYKKAPSGSSDYTSGGDTSMTLAALIQKNTAGTSGGGVAVGADNTISTYPSITVTGGSILGNEATNGNGGGVYMPGGAFILNGGEITGNTAQNGGGISISNGSFELGENAKFTISGNTATRYGGGLYVSDATQKVTFDGGTIEGNNASAGGGVALENINSTETTTLELNANVENNNATNGGGVYLNNNVSMNYTGGLLRNNTATSEITTLPNNTASEGTASTVTGVGGGVFMDSNTTLSFDISAGTPLGLYGNTATNAADDIFANGKGTTVILPSVAEMSLADFSVPASTLFWAEDYHTRDNSYPGLIKNDFSDPANNLRYQYALKNLKRSHIVDLNKDEHFETFKKAYVCLALGYQIYYVTIKKHGLQKNESALFNIYSEKEDVKIPSPYLTMLLTGDDSNLVEQRVALPEGSWRVNELTNWTWSYESKDGETEKPTFIVKQHINDNTVFEFYNKKATTVLHGEDIEVNTMGTSSSSSSTGGSSTPAQ